MLYFLVVNFNQFSQPRSSLSPQQAIFLKDSWQKVKSVLKGKWPIQLELIPVSIAWCGQEYYYFPLNRIPIHCKVSSQYFIKLPWQFMSTYLLYSGGGGGGREAPQKCNVLSTSTLCLPLDNTVFINHCWRRMHHTSNYCQGKEKEIPKVGCDAYKKESIKFQGYN